MEEMALLRFICEPAPTPWERAAMSINVVKLAQVRNRIVWLSREMEARYSGTPGEERYGAETI